MNQILNDLEIPSDSITNAVDRHLAQLVKEGVLTKLSGGLYNYPKQTSFGVAPADDMNLVEAFLNGHRFLLTTPNAYNALGVGSTQPSRLHA